MIQPINFRRFRGLIVDAVSELGEWIKTIVLGLLGLLVWYFKRSQDRIDKRLDELGSAVEARAMDADVERYRSETEQRIRGIEEDVKEMGDKFTISMREEIRGLRTEMMSTLQDQNKRLDQIMLYITNRNGGQR